MTEPPAADRRCGDHRRKASTPIHRNCLVCHGFFAQSEGEVPDLRKVPPEIWKPYDDIVLDGASARWRHGVVQGHADQG